MAFFARPLSAGILLACLTGLAARAQEELPTPGDTYMISRDDRGHFVGSHKIYDMENNGLYRVVYCGREYWILPYTVAWTQLEVENKRTVKVEYNFGKGWRPLCSNPDREVRLSDLGIARQARDVVNAYRRMAENSDAGGGGIDRFSAISRAFKQIPDQTGSGPSGSYHSQ